MAYLTLICLLVGLFMIFLLRKEPDAQKIGWILFASAVLAICIAAAPATVHLLQH